MEQLQSQGINLIFFIPIALLSLILHSKSKLIEWKTALLSAALGLLGAWAGWYIGGMICLLYTSLQMKQMPLICL